MEHLTEQPKSEYVTLPESLLKALYELQKEPRGYEWGGGIDFEIINDEPQVERILAYFGEEGRMPERVLRKYGDDIEVTFHTHPRQKKVQPSAADITSFFASPCQVGFIIAGEEIALLEKTPAFREEILKGISLEVPTYYNPKEAMPEIIEKLSDIGINAYLYPKSTASPVFDLNIIRQISESK